MPKTTDTKRPQSPADRPQPEATLAASQSKSSLPIVAAVLFLLSSVSSFLISMSTSVGTAGFLPGVEMLLTVLLSITLFLRRRQDLFPVALYLLSLSSLVPFVQAMANNLGSFDAVYRIIDLGLPIFSAQFLLMDRFKKRKNPKYSMQRIWYFPALMGAIFITLGAFECTIKNRNASPFVLVSCLNVYAYFFLDAWLAYPEMTFKGMITSIQVEPDVVSAGRILAWQFIKELPMGIGCGAGLVVVLGVMSLFECGDFSVLLENAFICPMLLFAFPAMWCIYQLISALRQAAKETKRIKHDINVINARGTGFVAEQAKAELRKEAGKKAANAVIKGALVGDLIGGDTGAVVGAMAAKAKLDQTTGSDGSMSDVTKGAVVGGIVAGSSSAVVGGLAAQAQKDAEDGIK